MAVCEICGKGPQFGHNVSHSKRATKRQFKPNIQKTKIWRDGRLVSVMLCAKCLKTLGKDIKR
jgi:large subunit ribosomal protein L28